MFTKRELIKKLEMLVLTTITLAIIFYIGYHLSQEPNWDQDAQGGFVFFAMFAFFPIMMVLYHAYKLTWNGYKRLMRRKKK